MNCIRRSRPSRLLSAFLLPTCLALLLAGCGGGSGDPTNTAEGFYTGTTNTGAQAALLVLENGQTFGMAFNGTGVSDGLYGTLIGNASTLRGGVGQDLNFAAHTNSAINWSGSLTPATSITASTTSGVTFTGSYRPGYTDAPNLAGLAGTYAGRGVVGINSAPEAITITVDSNGGVTFSTATCTVTGALYLRGNGKNVYSARLNFSGTSCGIANGFSTAGSAYLDRSVSPARFYFFTLINDYSDAFYWSTQSVT